MNRVLTILLWSIIPFIASAQPFSNKGKEFWVGYGHHQYMEPACGAPGDGPNDMNMVLYLSAEQPAQVTVTIDNGGAGFPPQWTRTYNIPANTVISTENLPKGATNAGPSGSDPAYDARLFTKPPPGGTGGEGLFQKRGIHIVSSVPIVAYAHIYGGVSSGATMLMPVHTWGYSYTSVNSEQGDASQSYSWMYVVAKDNNTRVRITPSAPSRAGKPANVPFEVALQKGEIYQLIGQADCATGNGPELTGTTVKSIAGADGACHPIAVFGGSSRTGGEAGLCGSSGRDNDMQQLFPEQAWGMLYLTAPFSKASSTTLYPNQFQRSVYKVVVKDPATQVRVNGGAPLTGLINNKYYKFSSSTADYITSDKPVMVAQFMPGGGTACNTGLGTDGDPEMVILSPTEQASKRVGFYRNTLQAINSNFLTLIVPTAGVASLRIDNSAVFSHTYPHSFPGYTVVVKGWAAAQAQCIVQCDSGFNAITYGLGGAESYGYNAGTNILNLNGVSDIHNVYDSTKKSNVFTCTKTPVELSALIAYKPTKLEWKLSTLGTLITPNADVTDNNPVPVDSTDVNGFRYYKYTLPQAYVFSQPGTYYLPLIATSPTIDVCTRSEEFSLEVIVKPTPVADFTFTQSGCRLDTVVFAALNNSGNGYTIDRWRWAYPGGGADSVQNPRHYFANTGPHNIYLKVLTPEGCMGDTIKPITLANIISNASIVAAQDSVCQGGSITFTDTATTTGVTSWYWDFGNGSTATVTANTPQTVTYPDYGDYTIKHVAITPTSGTCADTVRRVVTIMANPNPNFTWPAGCLPASGIVQFDNTSSVKDGQAIVSWNWNFGDAANSTSANPNTSTVQHPTHIYTNYNTYPIVLSVTSAKGCTKDTTINATFNIRPVLAHTASPAVCESVTGTVSVATFSVTNGITGTGAYSGPGTDAAGNFNPSVAGPGTHRIYYTFTSAANCVVIDSSDVLVKAKPKADFTFPPGCLPVNGLVQFTSTSIPAAGETITGHTWNFGDPNALPGNNTSTLTNPTHNYSNYGTYNIALIATSSNGCTDDTTIVATLGVTPQLAYPALPAVCENVPGTISVATASVTNGVTGTGVYSGPGTTATGNFSPLIAGPGTHTITYTFTATGGCSVSYPNTIVVHPKPNAVFTATSDICLNQAATIEDNSTIPSGNITAWNWNFGDGNTASYTNGNSFTRSWAAYNTYNVTLTATSNNGCTASKTMPVAVHALPVVDFGLPAGICVPGGNAAFNNLTTIADNAGLNYQWTFGDGGMGSSAPNPVHVYAARNAYNVNLTATSAYGCTGTVMKVLAPDKFFDKPVAAFKAAPEAVCQGIEQEFSDLSTAPNSTVRGWNWNFGDGSVSTVRNPAKKYRLRGEYTVALQVTNEVGCISDPVTHIVTVYLQPVIDAGGSFVVAQGTLVKFNPKVNDSTVVTFQWTPATDLSDATILRPTTVAQQDRRYRLTATGEGNCTATDELSIKILRLVKVPNAFSPNGDGVNDTWFIENLADYTNSTVEVFNRYGQRVYYAGGYNSPWNGTFNGKPLPVATYYYVIHLKNGFQPITGSVTILR